MIYTASREYNYKIKKIKTKKTPKKQNKKKTPKNRIKKKNKKIIIK